jgi:hypothetical protein
MGVNLVQGLVFQAVGQHTIDAVQAVAHATLNLIPIAGPYLAKVVGLVL